MERIDQIKQDLLFFVKENNPKMVTEVTKFLREYGIVSLANPFDTTFIDENGKPLEREVLERVDVSALGNLFVIIEYCIERTGLHVFSYIIK